MNTNQYRKKDNNKNIYDAKDGLRQNAMISNKNKIDITDDYEQANSVISIEKLVREIIQSEEDLFSIKEHRNEKKTIDYKRRCFFDKLKPFIDHDMEAFLSKAIIRSHLTEKIAKSYPIHKFNPYVALFIKKLNEQLVGNVNLYHCINRHDGCVNDAVDTLNDFITSIRSEAKTKQFKTNISNYQRLQKKNDKSLMTYIDKLFMRHSRLLVLRIDFSYGKYDHAHTLSEAEREAMYFRAKNDRERFFNNTRSNSLFEHMLGYVWKLEYGLEKGFHYHMLFFFDGSKVHEDISRAKMLGEYWENTITHGSGLFHNCNIKKEEYEKNGLLGIGMINHYDIELRENLKKAASYLTKPDYYVSVIAPDKGRTFGKGEIKAKTTNRGRPRKNTGKNQNKPMPRLSLLNSPSSDYF